MKYRYAAEYPVLYGNYLIPGEGSLEAAPGDVRDFGTESPPDDGRWVPVTPVKTVKEN